MHFHVAEIVLLQTQQELVQAKTSSPSREGETTGKMKAGVLNLTEAWARGGNRLQKGRSGPTTRGLQRPWWPLKPHHR